MIVVSSFLYSDINSTQVRPGTGIEFLKSYIEYASSGGRLLLNGELTTEPMNDFETDVYDALTSKGIGLVPQLGCLKFRIDLVACHPTAPGSPSPATARKAGVDVPPDLVERLVSQERRRS